MKSILTIEKLREIMVGKGFSPIVDAVINLEIFAGFIKLFPKFHGFHGTCAQFANTVTAPLTDAATIQEL